MSDGVSVEQVFDSILETWAAWGTSSGDPVDDATLCNANLMHVDLVTSLTLELGRLASRTESHEFSNAVNAAIAAISDAHEHRDAIAASSRTLDADSIDRKRVELGFEPRRSRG